MRGGANLGGLPRVLVVETNFVLRRTLAAVAADLKIARIDEAPTPEAARTRLRSGDHGALVLGVGDVAAGLRLLAGIRAGEIGAERGLHSIVLLDEAGADAFDRFVAAGADVTLRRPYKLSDIFSAIAGRPQARADGASVPRPPPRHAGQDASRSSAIASG